MARIWQRFGTYLTRLALVLGLLATAACSATYRSHGYAPSDEDLSAIVIGRDTRETVAAAVGRPGVGGVLADGAWYYVESRWRHFGPRAAQEIDRQVLAISFDGRGRVSNIERFGLEDGRVVALSRRVTETNIRGVSFLQQLLTNAGHFDPGAFFQRQQRQFQ